MTDKDQILQKVKKLLSLAEDKGNLNESAAAFAAAQALITKYKLSQAELNQNCGDIFNCDHEPLFQAKSKRIPTWKKSLGAVLCQTNSCCCFTSTNSRGKGVLKIVGASEDVELVRYLFDSICNQIEVLAKKALQERGGPKKGAKTFANNFRLGAVSTIKSRLEQEVQEIKKEYQGTTALTIVNSTAQKVKEFVDHKFNLTYSKLSYRADQDAYLKGRQAGFSVNLNPGLQGQDSKLIQ